MGDYRLKYKKAWIYATLLVLYSLIINTEYIVICNKNLICTMLYKGHHKGTCLNRHRQT